MQVEEGKGTSGRRRAAAAASPRAVGSARGGSRDVHGRRSTTQPRVLGRRSEEDLLGKGRQGRRGREEDGTAWGIPACAPEEELREGGGKKGVSPSVPDLDPPPSAR
jgi:hypothetical protein